MKVTQLCPTLCDSMGYTVHGILQARILEWVVFLFSRRSSQPRYSTQVSRITGRLFTSWAKNSPGQNTGMGSLSLLQEIFPTQGFNPGLPHCTWILYQLSHKGSPLQINTYLLWKIRKIQGLATFLCKGQIVGTILSLSLLLRSALVAQNQPWTVTV